MLRNPFVQTLVALLVIAGVAFVGITAIAKAFPIRTTVLGGDAESFRHTAGIGAPALSGHIFFLVVPFGAVFNLTALQAFSR